MTEGAGSGQAIRQAQDDEKGFIVKLRERDTPPASLPPGAGQAGGTETRRGLGEMVLI